MIIDGIVIRKANDISIDNEIAKFSNLYFVPQEGISAISFEIIDYKDINAKLDLLLSVLKICNGNELMINFMVCLQEQPNNRITRYKGGWKLLNEVDFEDVYNKKQIEIYTDDYVDFILMGNAFIGNGKLLKQLICNGGILYFSTNNFGFDNNACHKYDDWINNKLSHNEFVCFFLQTNWEQSNELVVMRKNNSIMNDEFIRKVCREINIAIP